MRTRDSLLQVRSPDGYVIVTIALTLFLLCGFVAFALDWGILLSARTAAQRAADSGALAGAFTFVTQPFSPQPTTAEQHALEATVVNEILRDNVQPGDVTVNVDVANRRVQVDIQRAENMFFARVLGWNQTNVAVRASAEAAAFSTGSSCTKPWFIPNTILSTQASCDACAAGELFISGGSVTPFAMSQIGTQFTVKPGNPQNSLSPGQFYAIAMPGSIGGSDYRDNIAMCAPGTVYCAQSYTVEPGNMIGPTAQGVRDLIGASPDTYIAPGQYRHADGTISDTSHQLIVAPIWDECAMPNFCPGNQLPDSGRNLNIPVIGFALIFLEGVQGNDVIARLIWVSACGGGGGGGGGPQPPETGPYSVPVRLVRMP